LWGKNREILPPKNQCAGQLKLSLFCYLLKIPRLEEGTCHFDDKVFVCTSSTFGQHFSKEQTLKPRLVIFCQILLH
jgi:hypothetical protein